MGRGGNNGSAAGVVTRSATTGSRVEELRRQRLQEGRLSAPRAVGDSMFSLVKDMHGDWQILEISPEAASLLRVPLECEGADLAQVEASYDQFLSSRQA